MSSFGNLPSPSLTSARGLAIEQRRLEDFDTEIKSASAGLSNDRKALQYLVGCAVNLEIHLFVAWLFEHHAAAAGEEGPLKDARFWWIKVELEEVKSAQAEVDRAKRDGQGLSLAELMLDRCQQRSKALWQLAKHLKQPGGYDKLLLEYQLARVPRRRSEDSTQLPQPGWRPTVGRSAPHTKVSNANAYSSATYEHAVLVP
ncbi:hypothetical protein JCM11641_006108 [Rhodosporidiobolus odoratus]